MRGVTDISHVLIRASAGTGKTFRLSNRYLGLLHRGVAPDQILATTFTRKAAGEILDRVMVRLAEAALKPDKLVQLASDLDLPHLTQAKCLELLRQLISLSAPTAHLHVGRLLCPVGWQLQPGTGAAARLAHRGATARQVSATRSHRHDAARRFQSRSPTALDT